MKKSVMISVLVLAVLALGYGAFAFSQRKPVEFFKGHSHVDGITVGAPEHSGGTDRWGCHNASVPYHCH
jgi:hypothetical protein